MHTVRIPLNTTSADDRIIQRRFYALFHVHNTLVSHAVSLLAQIKHNREYQALRQEYCILQNIKKPTRADKKRKNELSNRMSAIRKDIGLTEPGLQKYITVCAKQFRHMLSSQQVQKEASRVFRGVETILFRKGYYLHYKKNMDIDTIGGKSNTNGVKFDPMTLKISWLGLDVSCEWPKRPSDINYLSESLHHEIKYCEVERKIFQTKWHYYIVVYLTGDAPDKHRAIGHGIAGLDPGVSTMAVVSEKAVYLKELARRHGVYDKKIGQLSRRMDNSLRANNPKKYKADGTIDKTNHGRWIYSKNYKKLRLMRKTRYRRKAAYIKQSHEELCNKLLESADVFITEKMLYKGLQLRSKKPAERTDKVSYITQKDGSAKPVRKFKRKRQYGKSLNDRSPSLFLAILKRKAESIGGGLIEVDTRKFKASQYHHDTGQYVKASRSERFKTICGYIVQRDLYSAFLLWNSDTDLTHTDRQKCINTFADFLKLHNGLIADMKTQHISMKQCFGF